jgi:hypothetical protein
VVKIAVDLRDAFRPYRSQVAEYRQLQNNISVSQNYAAAKRADNMKESFEQALQASMKKVDTDLSMTRKVVFDGLQGIRKVAIALAFQDYKTAIEEVSERLTELLKGWCFMNYGGVYEIVSQYPHLEQLNASCRRLVNKDLDAKISQIVRQAAHTLQNNYGLTGVGVLVRSATSSNIESSGTEIAPARQRRDADSPCPVEFEEAPRCAPSQASPIASLRDEAPEIVSDNVRKFRS